MHTDTIYDSIFVPVYMAKECAEMSANSIAILEILYVGISGAEEM